MVTDLRAASAQGNVSMSPTISAAAGHPLTLDGDGDDDDDDDDDGDAGCWQMIIVAADEKEEKITFTISVMMHRCGWRKDTLFSNEIFTHRP